jgi:hypothetical protein
MARKWIIINLLLLAAAGLLGWRLQASINQFNAENDPATIQPARDVRQAVLQEKMPLPAPAPPIDYHPAEFAIIPERTIFSESRSKGDLTGSVPVVEPAQMTQRPILVGITVADNHYGALLIDQAAAMQGRTRRAELKRIGDFYQGYTITAIASDHIVMESGTRREIIPLHEGSKQAQAGKTPILSTRVVAFGGGGVSGGTPVPGGATGIPEIPRVPATQIVVPGATRTQEIISPAGRGGQVTAPAPVPEDVDRTPPTSQPQPAGGTRVIRTPFGDIIRPGR